MTQIPHDRKRGRPVRLVILLGMTVLLFVLILTRFGQSGGQL